MVRETGARGPFAASPAGAAIRSGRGPVGTPAPPPSHGAATGQTAQVWLRPLGLLAEGEWGREAKERENSPMACKAKVLFHLLLG